MKKFRLLTTLLPILLTLTGCAATKSEDPLSPTIAGPLPGVGISAPTPVEPAQGAQIAVAQQPVSLAVQNATTTGVRPLSYLFEVALDSGFTNLVFSRDNVAPGDGRTIVRLPDALGTGRTYYWRSRAQDGANTGPYSHMSLFNVFTPIVIGRPTPRSPGGGETVSNTSPTFVVDNVFRSGPVGLIKYVMEISTAESFAGKFAIWQFDEQGGAGGQTSLPSPQGLGGGTQYFWHVHAYDSGSDNSGEWSSTQVFKTPAAPPPPPGGGGGGGGNGTSGHLPPGPPTAKRAQDVVLGTAAEFPGITATSDAEQMLRRIIWHLHLNGMQAARQRNPSGLISNDKVNIQIEDGTYHVFDIFSLGAVTFSVQFFDLNCGCANLVQDAGIPD